MVEELFEAFEDLFEGRKKKKKKEEREAKRVAEYRVPTPLPLKPRVFCISCGTRNEGESRFCGECGELLPSAGQEMRCLRCEAALPLTAKFCGQCGAKAAV